MLYGDETQFDDLICGVKNSNEKFVGWKNFFLNKGNVTQLNDYCKVTSGLLNSLSSCISFRISMHRFKFTQFRQANNFISQKYVLPLEGVWGGRTHEYAYSSSY